MGETITISGSKKVQLFTDEQIKELTRNGNLHPKDHDAVPCVYLLGENNSYLISEICCDRNNNAYGIINERGKLTIDFIDLDKLYDYHENQDFLFNDEKFSANYRISVFMSVAKEMGRIVADDLAFKNIFKKYLSS